jgi:hypothetical protein
MLLRVRKQHTRGDVDILKILYTSRQAGTFRVVMNMRFFPHVPVGAAEPKQRLLVDEFRMYCPNEVPVQGVVTVVSAVATMRSSIIVLKIVTSRSSCVAIQIQLKDSA